MKKIKAEARRTQIITTIGVGGMYVRKNGSSVIICGLDHWLDDLNESQRSELRIDDARLRKKLKVGKLYKPPALIEDFDDDGSNRSLAPSRIPVLRFPSWFVCSKSFCGRLSKEVLTYSQGTKRCPAHEGKKVDMYQVSYVVMCKSGHLDDFPWKEFVHRSVNPDCATGVLRITGAFTGDPQNTVVRCSCGKFRKMSDAMGPMNKAGRTTLSTKLDSANEFKCRGYAPWLGGLTDESQQCENDVEATFRGAGHVYFPFVETSLLIPEGTARNSLLLERLQEPYFIKERNQARSSDFTKAAISAIKTVEDLSQESGSKNWIKIENFDQHEIEEAFKMLVNQDLDVERSINTDSNNNLNLEFRYSEFRKLRDISKDAVLTVANPEGNYENVITDNFSNIKLVTSLTETKAFTGFARVNSENRLSMIESRKLLSKKFERLGTPSDWLPAVQVKGEGIFLELDERKMSSWASQRNVLDRFRKMELSSLVNIDNFELSPQFTLLHTLSHLFMKELAYFCGYSQASLRERIYSSNSENTKMQGILIYTASGDSEGTLGGLVRMGKPGYLEEVMQNSLEKSLRCSNESRLYGERTKFKHWYTK
jgi:hypothetical protein